MEAEREQRARALVMKVMNNLRQKKPDPQDQINFVGLSPHLRAIQRCLRHMYHLVTMDRYELMQDLRMLATVLKTVEDLVMNKWQQGQAFDLQESAMYYRPQCQRSVIGNVVEYTQHHGHAVTVLDEVISGQEKFEEYSGFLAFDPELRQLWEGPMSAMEDIILALRVQHPSLQIAFSSARV